MIADRDKPRQGAAKTPVATKKLRLLNLVQRHPFLSVDEIAESVGTTPRYVRTALSEAGLSLVALRRRHAHKLRQRVPLTANGPEEPRLDVRLSGRFPSDDEAVGIGDVWFAHTTDQEISEMLHTSPDCR